MPHGGLFHPLSNPARREFFMAAPTRSATTASNGSPPGGELRPVTVPERGWATWPLVAAAITGTFTFGVAALVGRRRRAAGVAS